MDTIFLIYFENIHYYIDEFYCVFTLKSTISAGATSGHIFGLKKSGEQSKILWR